MPWARPELARRFFNGPGLNNYDMALLKNLRLTESKSLQFRVEAFNVFNHAQFFGPQAVDGNIDQFYVWASCDCGSASVGAIWG